MARQKTIEQLARSLDVDVSDLSKAASQILDLPSKHVRDSKYLLNAHQCSQLEVHFRPAESPASLAAEGERQADLTQNAPLTTRHDPPSIQDSLKFGNLNHGLWVHPDVLDTLEQEPQLRKRLGIVLQHLGAHGRTSVVKGCSDKENKGWLRSPLGGNSGMQYYLWWTAQGSRPAKTINLSAGDILVRAVRHHDDHGLLDAEEWKDYLHFQQAEIDDDDLVGQPWTEEQLQFVDAADPVRLVLGRPGSGKTTVLWKAVEARSGQRVLYLTWSRELTRYAMEHFQAFAPLDVHIEARDFSTFIGEICGTDIKRLTLQESQATFLQATKRLQRQVLGLWAGREYALFAELRAFLIGQAIPNEDGVDIVQGLVRLSDEAYLRQRGDHEGVGPEAANSLLKIFELLQSKISFTGIFPELIAAADAIARLRRDEIPEGFADFDRIVIDEVQDLTLLEAAVIVEFCRAVARHNRYAPWLLIAGDDGQTVRPSGFDWGTLNDLIARRVETPRKFQLEDNLRCPTKIAEVIERASKKYTHLEKAYRPTKQGHRLGGQHVDAHLLYVNVPSVEEAKNLLENLDDIDDVVILSPQDDNPPWVPSHLKDVVLTPADAKGLEYQSVILLNPGKLLASSKREAMDANVLELEEHAYRTTIDRLRVALSRATETLAFVDVEASDEEQDLSLALLGSPVLYDPEDLIEHFTDSDASPEERVLARTRDARSLIDERPGRAWRRAFQAIRLLGDPSLPNGVANEDIRLEASHIVLATAARLLIDGIPQGIAKQDLVSISEKVLQELKSKKQALAFKRLDQWCETQSMTPFALLDATLSLGKDGEWLRDALSSVAQNLRQAIEDYVEIPETAKAFTGDISGWLELTGFLGDKKVEARKLRCRAMDTLLLRTGDTESAEKILKKIDPPDLRRTGHLREAQACYEEAAEAFEGAALPEDALRNWRQAGDWRQAIQVAERIGTVDKSDLQWLVDLEDLLNQRPSGHAKRLTKGEHHRLSQLLKSTSP